MQNSANPVENIKENPMIDSQEDEDIEEELPIPQPKNNYERAKEAFKLEETFHKKPPDIKPIDTKKELAKIAGVSYDTIERVKTISVSVETHELLFKNKLHPRETFEDIIKRLLDRVVE